MKYNVKRGGLIHKGYVNLNISKDGTVHYSGKVTLKIGWFKKDQSFSGSRNVGANVVLSKNYTDNFEESSRLKISIYERSGNYAKAHAHWRPDDINVNTNLYLGNELIHIEKAIAKVDILGYGVSLTLTKA